MIYVGATVTVITGAVKPTTRKPLTNVDVAGVTFSIIGPGDVTLAADLPMAWDAETGRFVAEYDPPAVAGDYLAGIVWHGLNGSASPAWRPFRIEPRPTTGA